MKTETKRNTARDMREGSRQTGKKKERETVEEAAAELEAASVLWAKYAEKFATT